MRSLGVRGRTNYSQAHERNQQVGENNNIDIGRCQWLWQEGNARINKVSAMKPGLAKIIEKVRISWYFESPEADLHLAENACCIHYANTWSPKRVHWLSKSQSPHGSTSHYGCKDTFELYSGVARAHLPIMGIHTQVASKPKLRWIPATIHNSGWMDDFQVSHGSIEAILILGPMDVEGAYSHIASRHHIVKWHVRSNGWRDASFSQEEDTTEERLVLCSEVSSTEAFQILCSSDSTDRHASDLRSHPRSFPEVAIIYDVGQGNAYQRWGRDILHYTIPRGVSEVCREWIQCQTLTCAGQYTRNGTEQQSRPLCNSFRVLSIILWSIWFVQR